MNTCINNKYPPSVFAKLCTVKPPLVNSPNKGHLPLIGQHDMHGLNFSISINLPTKDTSIFKDNTECTNVSVRFYCKCTCNSSSEEVHNSLHCSYCLNMESSFLAKSPRRASSIASSRVSHDVGRSSLAMTYPCNH